MARLLLTCVHSPECLVTLEPWGSEFVIKAGESLTFESEAIDTGNIEISPTPDGLSIWVSSSAPVKLTDGDGNDVPF